ncbi:MAG TPA: MFS transporter, partial [Methylomirabilota bacterium]|nr:MFS transporter [Methylomirabilota bacterium]
ALNHRDFRLFWSGQLVSLVGRWMQSVGQSWLVLELTGSPLKLGIVNSLQFAPILVLSFLAGAIADRFSKRRLLVLSQATLMVPAFGLAALTWTGRVEYWHVVVLATVMGIANALDMPARQSMIVELVGKDDLINAIALNSGVFNAARIVGPAVGGVLIARYGVAIAFLLNGLTYLPVIAALLMMRLDPLPRVLRGTTIRAEIADGLRYAMGSPLVSLILSLVLVVSVFTINHNVVVPLVAREVLRLDVQGFGFLMAAVGAGAVVAAAILAQFGRARTPVAALVAGAVVVSAGLLALAAVREFRSAAAVLFVMGLAQILFLSSCNTTLQVTVPDELRGRVMSLYTLAFAGVSPFGAFLIAGIAEAFGAPAACAAGGGLGLACVLAFAARGARQAALTPAPSPRAS